MSEKEYVINIGNLKVSGPAEDILELSKVYEHAAKDYHNSQDMLLKSAIPGGDELAGVLKEDQRKLEEISKRLSDTVSESEYYKNYISERNSVVKNIVNSLMEEDEHDER